MNNLQRYEINQYGTHYLIDNFLFHLYILTLFNSLGRFHNKLITNKIDAKNGIQKNINQNFCALSQSRGGGGNVTLHCDCNQPDILSINLKFQKS